MDSDLNGSRTIGGDETYSTDTGITGTAARDTHQGGIVQ